MNSIPVLGIPHYNRSDLTVRCIESIDYPVDLLVVIDNSNGRLCGPPGWQTPTQFIARQENIYHPNAGVAGSWNEVIKLFPAAWWMLVNNDIQFTPGDLRKMAELVWRETAANNLDAGHHPSIGGNSGQPELKHTGKIYGNHGASWFSITPYGVETVGLFDENIFPAYLEDCDWSRRADLLGVRRFDVQDVHAIHGEPDMPGCCTVRSDAELGAKNKRTHGGNFEYYRRKWGGLNETEIFQHPFNDPHWPMWAWKFEPATRARQQW